MTNDPKSDSLTELELQELKERSKAPNYRKVRRVPESDGPGTPTAKAPDPDLPTLIIPKERYTSADHMQREWQHMWTKVWLLGGLEADIPEPGDYIATEIGRESILLVRQIDGSVRAFFNVCLHRGNRLRPSGISSAETFKCQYHHWEYGIDGRFVRIPDLDTFPQGAPPCRGLRGLPCDTWGGFVWFSLDPNVEPLRTFLDPIPQHLDPYQVPKMVLTRDITVEWSCNWKASVDAFNESYHVQGIHPQLLYYLHDLDIQIDCYDRHNRYLIPFGTVSPRVRKPPSIPDPIKSIMKTAGMDPADYDEPLENLRRDVQAHKRRTGASMGKDYSQLNDDQLTDDYHYLIFPNVTLNVHADDLMLFRQRPHPTDPNQMFYDIWTFELLPDGAERPARPKHQHFQHGDKSIGLVLDQDAQNLPGVQEGMHSSGFEGLWIGSQELRIRHFHKVLDDYLEGRVGSAK
ncbi:MAG: aromatic ring-hydroxylating dioxygenase subunit alpha [Gammaproteobacteria bacterium]|jgi:phenylpropionate dioxygenase-like ring-hydroxylating dioxygenase large terminal subunit|nr:aromatic ring-hydroxylating dioxygenase subunit alpha [Gammaproteobacteria bacterium]